VVVLLTTVPLLAPLLFAVPLSLTLPKSLRTTVPIVLLMLSMITTVATVVTNVPLVLRLVVITVLVFIVRTLMAT